MSVSGDINNGLPNLATANNWFESLYNPNVVTYGLKNEPVAKEYNEPLSSDCNDGL